MSAENDRAAAYRAQQAARYANKGALEAALVPAVPMTALFDDWKALMPVDEHGVPRLGCEDQC